MNRTSISFTQPNAEWINAQIKSQEFNNKSDVVNNLIRRARSQQDEMDYLRAKLIAAEKSGFSELSTDEILEKSKESLRRNGEL